VRQIFGYQKCKYLDVSFEDILADGCMISEKYTLKQKLVTEKTSYLATGQTSGKCIPPSQEL
jgi:hypothetical protein